MRAAGGEGWQGHDRKKARRRKKQIPEGNDRKKGNGQYRGLSAAHHKDKGVMLRSR